MATQVHAEQSLWLRKPENMPTEWRHLDGVIWARLVSRTPYCNVQVTMQDGSGKPSEDPDVVEDVTAESAKDEEFMAHLRRVYGNLEVA